jgi:hypothetical protein
VSWIVVEVSALDKNHSRFMAIMLEKDKEKYPVPIEDDDFVRMAEVPGWIRTLQRTCAKIGGAQDIAVDESN